MNERISAIGRLLGGCLALLILAATATAAATIHGSPRLDEIELEEALAKVEVRWQGKSFKGDELPDELGKGPKSVVEAWAPWVLEHSYQLNLTKDQRVMLISSKRNGKLARQLKLIDETQRLFDKLVPAPPREEIVEPKKDPAGKPKKPKKEELPEDPEGGPVGWGPENQEPQEYTYSYEWGSGTWPVDTETCVMFVVHDEEDYGSLVDRLGEMQDYLAVWAKTGKRFTGFVHERPLVAAYIENASGQEEWDPDNEVVHRIAQMLFVRRFSSQQPYWLVQGFSWYVENKIRKSIYCFPYRDEFVWATEHTAWESELRTRFGKRKESPLMLSEFAEWQRGSYQGDVAKVSWGLVGYITRYHPEEFSAFIEAMRLYTREHNRIDLGGGSWKRDPDYMLAPKDQLKFAQQFFGDEFLANAAEYFRLGSKFRLKK